MAQTLQHDPTALISELPTTSTANIGPDTASSGSGRSDAVVSIPLVQNIRQVRPVAFQPTSTCQSETSFSFLFEALRAVCRAATLRCLGLLFLDREGRCALKQSLSSGLSPVQAATIAATTEAPSQP